jgi:hypothetical protein
VPLGIDQYIAGIKRIFVRSKDRNENPAIESVTWDGKPWAQDFVPEVTPCDTTDNRYDRCSGADAHEVAIQVTPGSFEAGTDEFGQSFVEQLVVQYYATEGLFEHDVRIAHQAPTNWVARKPAAGKTLDMWLVARDNRGGVVWATRKVKVK